jgi:hypothetical protein
LKMHPERFIICYNVKKPQNEYYRLRGCDEASGLQTQAGLEALDLGDATKELDEKELLY